MSPVRQRIQDILRGGIFSIQKPDVFDTHPCAGLARLHLPDISQCGGMLSAVIVGAAVAVSAVNHCHTLVQIVDRPRQIRCHRALIIGVRHHHQDVRFETLVRSPHRARCLRSKIATQKQCNENIDRPEQ